MTATILWAEWLKRQSHITHGSGSWGSTARAPDGCLSVVSSHGREESERERERKERERERASASSPGSSYEGANPIHEDVTLVT